jgi:hypothetical protein
MREHPSAVDGVLSERRCDMNSLLKDLLRIGRFTPTTSYQRFAYVFGVLLVVSGVVHLGVFLVDGGGWGGPLSWRKPVVFGLSFGITLMTVAWLTTFMRLRPVTGWALLGPFTVAGVGEVALISMQTWRGVASHFNEDTAFDGAVFSAMGMLVAVIALVIAVVTVRSFFSLDAPSSLALAIRLGLVLMLASQAVGVQMIAVEGNTFGAAGALKVPHALTLHVAHVLPAIALLLLASQTPESRRVRVVGLGALGYALVILSSLMQTYAGRAPLDLALGSTMIALGGLALLLTAAVVALDGLRRRSEPVHP